MQAPAPDDRPPRTLVVNGRPTETAARTLAEFLREAGYADEAVATARNGAFVAAGQRATIALAAGDNIEILAARQGG